MVANFDKRVLGQAVFIDMSHKPSEGAAAKVMRLAVEGGKPRALAEWTPFGLDAIKTRGFCYLSAQYHEGRLQRVFHLDLENIPRAAIRLQQPSDRMHLG